MYSFIRRLLFLFDAETAHVLSLKLLSLVNKFRLLSPFLPARIESPVNVMGIEFPNAIGLAAGLDKNASHIDALAQCGFGFIEVGTVTPLAQPGNDKPRLFRLVADEAIINRMGFNNNGVASLVNNVIGSHHGEYKNGLKNCVLGINIGKNKNTPLENAADDYLICMDHVYSHADYITINISSPNTPGLRELQHGEGLTELLSTLKNKQSELANQYHRYVPLAVKIAPDLDEEEVNDIASRLIATKIDAVIATNTTNNRPDYLIEKQLEKESGGLSGRPVYFASNKVLKLLAPALNGKIPIIAAGGVSSQQDAIEKISLGASLVQIYTGFIYSGPKLIRDCAKAIKNM